MVKTSIQNPILPDAWLGILGGGQLGRFFCFAAQTLGYRVLVLDPDPDSPAGAIAHQHLCAHYDDKTALLEMANQCAAITTEFENVPAESLRYLAEKTIVFPTAQSVATVQNRITEKAFLNTYQIDVGPYLPIESALSVQNLSNEIQEKYLPGILKTARFGYDGKGQITINDIDTLNKVLNDYPNQHYVLEKKLDIQYEFSALLARNVNGETVVYSLAENTHENGILIKTIAPAPNASVQTVQKAKEIALLIAEKLNYVGVFCVEFFMLKTGQLVVNEMAPRPHNTGHYTLNANVANQFEQQVRAITGLPLGSAYQHSFAVMLNLLGDSWFNNGNTSIDSSTSKTPNWQVIMAIPEAKLHLYGKNEARIGRKMGHINFVSASFDKANQAADYCADTLHNKKNSGV